MPIVSVLIATPRTSVDCIRTNFDIDAKFDVDEGSKLAKNSETAALMLLNSATPACTYPATYSCMHDLGALSWGHQFLLLGRK